MVTSDKLVDKTLVSDTGGKFGMSVITGMTVMSVTVGWYNKSVV